MRDIDWGFWAVGLIILVLCTALIATAIFSIPMLDEGIVIEKKYSPERIQVMPVRTGKVTCMIPRRTKEKWEIKVEGTKDNGKKRVEWWTVTKEEYDRIQIGQTIKRTE